MGKTNYTKVDEILKSALLRFSIDEMLEYTAAKKQAEALNVNKSAVEEQLANKKQRHLLVARLRFEIDKYFKRDRKLYSALQTNHDEIEGLLNKIDELSTEEATRLKAIADALAAYKLQHDPKNTPDENLTIVDKAREKSPNERFNVRKGWLPL